MKVSVALASYNGSKYIKEQLESILSQLGTDDEIIVSDDNSIDDTLQIVNSFQDKRIKVFVNPNKGVVANFNNALSHTIGDMIFLCDQDDVWKNNKVSEFKAVMEFDKPMLVVSDVTVVDGNLNPNGEAHTFRRGLVRNFVKNTYIGATMCCNRLLLNKVIPFDNQIPMHDIIIGQVVERKKYKVVYIPKSLMLYRRHGNNATNLKKSSNSFMKKIKLRIQILKFTHKAIKKIDNGVTNV